MGGKVLACAQGRPAPAGRVIVEEAERAGDHVTLKDVNNAVGRARHLGLLTHAPPGKAGGELTAAAIEQLRTAVWRTYSTEGIFDMSSIDTIAQDGRRLPAGSKAPKNARYRVRYRTPDGRSRTMTFARHEDADRFKKTVDSSKLTGSYVDRSAGEMAVAEYGAHWIATRRTPAGRPLQPRTRGLYDQLLATHIAAKTAASSLGGVRLRDLSPTRVAAWRSKLNGEVAPAKAYRLLQAMMTTPVNDELIARNPCKVENGGVEHSPERPMPTGDEVWQLADAIEPRYRALVLLAAFAGLRWSELTALRRADLNLEERTVTVCREACKSEAARRTVSVPPVLVPELRAHLDAFVDDDDAFVFAGPKGAVPERSNFHSVWKRARTKVGRDDLHLHDLRHFGATLAATAGASTKELMARLGHASPAAALRYQHATAERDRALAERMDALIAGGAAHDPPSLRVVRGG
jgi:integrase